MAYLTPSAKGVLDKTLTLAENELNRIDMQQATNNTKALASKGLEVGATSIELVKNQLSRIDMQQATNNTKALASKGLEVGATSIELVKNQLSRIDTHQAASGAKSLASKGFEAAKTGLANIDLKETAAAAKDWAVKHPYQASFHIVSGVVLLAPAVVTMPILGAVGFGATGVTAGSSAAAIQAGVGNVVANGGFACLQSAAMGGYGLGVVNGVAQGVAVAAQAVGVGAGVALRQKQLGREEGGDGEGDVAVDEVEVGGGEEEGQDPAVEDGVVDMEDEAAVKSVRSKV